MDSKGVDRFDSHSTDEAQAHRKKGGWITFPFIIANVSGLTLAMKGSTANIIPYLIKYFNFKSIDAAQLSNIMNGCEYLAPVAGAILSDSYFGCFPVVRFSSIAMLLSMIMFTLTATIRTLSPPPCTPGSTSCASATRAQLAVLYGAIAVLVVGSGGTRFNNITMGADQFDEVREQDVFFNWYFIVVYLSSAIGATVIVYVEDSVSWGLGFGLCAAMSVVAVIALLLGAKYYRRRGAQGSPFTGLVRVAVAAIAKMKVVLPAEKLAYYVEPMEEAKGSASPVLSGSFRFFNRAALITQGVVHQDGSIARPWKLCTIQRVEDLKSLIRIVPLWISSITLSICIGTQQTLSVLQALTMDRTLGRHFTIPAGSFFVSTLAATAATLFFLDHTMYPAWNRLTGHKPSTLQRIGVGHVFNVASMVASALVERTRARTVDAYNAAGQGGWIVPMSALWLVVPLGFTGVGEAFHFPGQVAFFYQEFPKSLKSTATGMMALIVSIGFYGSTAVVDLVRRSTSWLPDNINESRLSNVYWMLAVAGAVNFGYYVVCAKLYEYQSDIKQVDSSHGEGSD